MKKIILCALVAAALFSSCKDKSATAAAPAGTEGSSPAGQDKTTSKADYSYAFGMAIGTSLKQTGVAVDYSAFSKGMKDVLEDKKTKVTMEEANKQIQAAMSEAGTKLASDASAKEKKFLEENGKKQNVVTTASGLQYEVLKEGSGAKPQLTDTVKVDYVGTLQDGKTFDSSVERGEPAVFPLAQVIPGWQEGIQLMSVGSKYRFFIPSALAYGTQGAGGVIGPNATLIFEVDLLSIEPPAKK